MATNHFDGFVGQAHVIQYFNDLINGRAKKEIPFQPCLFTGHAGLGKTSFVKQRLRNVMKGYSVVELSCSISMSDFLMIWQEEIEGKKVIIFFDEAHDIRNYKVLNLIKRLTDTDKKKEELNVEKTFLTSDPYNHLWIFSSNEKMDDALVSRCVVLNFQPLTREETRLMIAQMSARWGIKANKDAVEYLANRVFPITREISNLVSNEMNLMLKNIDLKTAKELVVKYERFPLGLRRPDLSVLAYLGKDSTGRQVNEIANAIGGEDRKTTSNRLAYLAGEGLIKTINSRKQLTEHGAKYLRALTEQKA